MKTYLPPPKKKGKKKLLYFLLILLCIEPEGHDFLDLKNAKLFVQMIFIYYCLYYGLIPKACSGSWTQDKITHCHKGVLQPLCTFWRGFSSAETMERWSKVSEHPLLILWLRKVFWEWDRKGVIALFFVTFSALLPIVAHRFLLFAAEGIYFDHACLQKRQFHYLAFYTG